MLDTVSRSATAGSGGSVAALQRPDAGAMSFWINYLTHRLSDSTACHIVWKFYVSGKPQVAALQRLDAGAMYFWMKDLTQEFLKLSIIYSSVEIFDKVRLRLVPCSPSQSLSFRCFAAGVATSCSICLCAALRQECSCARGGRRRLSVS